MISETQMLRDLIATLMAENAALRSELSTDPLTGIGNRRAYDRRVASTTGQESYVVIDVNLFKQINDSLGHQAGDQVLQQIASCIRRETDTCYRTGGDEFVLILDMPDQSAIKVAKRICRAVSKLRAGTNRLSISFGVGSTYQEADQKMYLMKKAAN